MKVFCKNLVITGKPGCGKTTLVRETLLPFKARASGFITEEIREGGVRMGFRLSDLDGHSGILASKARAGTPRLNKYGIDLAVLEGIGVAAVRKAMENNRIAVIDEIGAMEVLSQPFREAVLAALSGPGPVLATIRLGAQPFTDAIKSMEQTEVLTLTKDDFTETRGRVRDWLAWAAKR